MKFDGNGPEFCPVIGLDNGVIPSGSTTMVLIC